MIVRITTVNGKTYVGDVKYRSNVGATIENDATGESVFFPWTSVLKMSWFKEDNTTTEDTDDDSTDQDSGDTTL